jgi:hypothetical protein
MALSTARIIGRDLTVTASGTKTIWNSFNVNFTANTDNATAADSTLDEVVITTKLAEVTCGGFLGSVNNGGTLPAIGATISDLAVAVGADTVIPSVGAYTNMKVLTAKV